MYRTVDPGLLTALLAVKSHLHFSHVIVPLSCPHNRSSSSCFESFLVLSLVFSSFSLPSAVVTLIRSLSHISSSFTHFIYSMHSHNEWSNHSAIKCKQPRLLFNKRLHAFACSAIQIRQCYYCCIPPNL